MRRRRLIAHIRAICSVSERRACRALELPRSSVRYRSHRQPDEDALRAAVIGVVKDYGYYGYRMVTGMLRGKGWRVNHKRVARIWREEGLKVPKRQRKRRHLWLRDGSCVRLRAAYANHVWSYDFVEDRLSNGRKIRMLTLIDEHQRRCLAIRVGRRLNWEDVVECLKDLFVRHGLPEFIRSDNGSEFTTERVRLWLQRLGVTTTFIKPGSPWENGYIESFNGTLRRELLDREVFDTLLEAQVLIERWRHEYNEVRPHSSLGYRPPAPESIVPFDEIGAEKMLLKVASWNETYRFN